MSPPAPPRRLKTLAHMHEGRDWLVASCPPMARAHAVGGPFPLRLRPGGFAMLLRAIVGQQVSTAAAQAIWLKTEAVLGEVSPQRVLAAGDAELRAGGLSRAKARYARALAEHCQTGTLNFKRLPYLSDDEVREVLTAVPGIGVWTADIYLLAAMGRSDAFPVGDLALQEAARDLMGLEARPTPKAFEELSQIWRPWRGVAARMLWQYYSAVRNREIE